MDAMLGREQGNLRDRLVAVTLAVVVMVCLHSTAAFAQCTLGGTLSTWNDGSSNWNSASHWSPSGVPNSGSNNVCITDGSSAVSLDINATVNNLQLAKGNTLAGNLGASLNVAGTQIINGGQIVINGGGGSNASLVVNNNVTLSGGGTLTLSTAGGGGDAFIMQGVGGLTLTNVDNTIQGSGVIGQNGLALVNEAGGTINANGTPTNALLFQSGTVTNQGLMEATGSGLLQINGEVVNNAGGTIAANGEGASVQFYGGTQIQGGTLINNGGALFGTANGHVAYLDGSTGAGPITINGTYTSDLNSSTNILGTIVNNGNLLVSGGNGTNTALLVDSANVTLQGGGTVTLSSATGGGFAFLEQAAGGLTLTNVDNTIQGSGIIGQNSLNVVNQSGGIINANSTGGSLLTGLTIQNATVTNAGLMEATNSGVLEINGVPVSNQGGTIRAVGSGASVLLYGNTDIMGGTLTNSGGAFFGTPNGQTAYLDGSTAAGPITINGTYTSDLNSSTGILGTINNHGNLQVNGGNGTNTGLYVDSANVTLQGGGTVTLSTAANGGEAYILQGAGGLVLTNADNTIQGSGVIGQNDLTLVNQAGGTINANGTPTSALLFQLGAVTNQGLMEATGSGVLQINGDVVNNLGGQITANGGTVQFLGGAVIQGGTLTNNGGTLGTPAGYVATLDGNTQGPLTLTGTYTSDLGTQTALLGTINNNKNLQLNGGSGTNSFLVVGDNVTLQGGGTVTMSTAGGGGSALIQQAAGGLTLTNVNNTIQGSGFIGNNGLTLVNQAGGTINATGTPTAVLALAGGPVTNQGLMEAAGSGVLQISGDTVNNAGGSIAAQGAGASVQLFGSAVIQGGTLRNNGGAFFGTPIGQTAYLDGSTGAGPITINGTYTSHLNSSTGILGTINNHGNLQLNGGGGNNTGLYVDSANVTLQGGGTVTLSTSLGGGDAYILQGAGGLVLTNADNTIQGSGVIGQNGLTLVNQAGGTINATGTPTSLLVFQSGAVTNQGLMEATGSGVLAINGDTVNNAGGTIAANGGTVQLVGSAVIQGGTLTNNGGTLGTPAGNVAVLDGSTGAGAVTLNGTYTSDLGSQTYLLGTINNNSNLQLNGGNGSNSSLIVDSNVTLGGGGTVSLSIAAGGGNAFILQAAGGLTLENVNNIIQGAGIIGQNGLTVLNDAGGAILANIPGQNLFVNGGGTLTNNGTLQVNSGSLLNVQNVSLTNFGGNTLTGGTYIVNGTLSSPGTMQINPLGNTGGEIVNNAATIVLNGLNSNLVDAAGLDALSNFSNNTAAGSFTIQNGRNLTTPGNLSNAGVMTVGNGSTLQLGGSGTNGYNQSGGLTQGTGTIAGAINITGGTIVGGSSTTGTPGTLTLTGTLNQTGGTFAELIGGTANFSLINATGNVTLGTGAQLSITLLNGFNPVGDTFTILNDLAGIVSGQFANGPASGFQMDGINWTIAYNGNNIVLNGVSQVGSTITAVWNTASGDWTTAAKWSCAPGSSTCVPDNSNANVYAAVLNSGGNTLSLLSTSTPSSITVDTLTLTAGTLEIGAGAALNLANQPAGLTDIPSAAGLTLAGTFTKGGSTSALAGLTSVEGTLTLEGQTITATPGTGTFTNAGTSHLEQTTALTLTGNFSNSGTIWTGDGHNDTGSNALNVSGNLTNNWQIYIEGTGDSLSAAKVVNAGTIELLAPNQTLTDNGDFNNNAGAYFETGGISNAAAVTVAGNLTNTDGFVEMLGTNGQMTVNGNVSNSGLSEGLIQVGGALGTGNTLSVMGNFTNGAGGVLFLMNDKSRVDVGGTFTNNSGASVQMNGSNGALAVAGAFNNNGGSVSLAGSGDTLSAGGGFTNSGSVSVGAGETVKVTNAYTQSGAGSSTKLDGSLVASGGAQINGGTLLGNAGTITGDVTLAGVLSPGDASNTAGTINIAGDYIQTATGVFDLGIGGLVAGSQFDLLSITGTAGLDGTLTISLENGFFPAVGDTFTFLLASSGVNSEFSAVNGLNIGNGESFALIYNANSVELKTTGATPPVPEPGSLLLLGTGLLGLASYYRARRTRSRS